MAAVIFVGGKKSAQVCRYFNEPSLNIESLCRCRFFQRRISWFYFLRFFVLFVLFRSSFMFHAFAFIIRKILNVAYSRVDRKAVFLLAANFPRKVCETFPAIFYRCPRFFAGLVGGNKKLDGVQRGRKKERKIQIYIYLRVAAVRFSYFKVLTFVLRESISRRKVMPEPRWNFAN